MPAGSPCLGREKRRPLKESERISELRGHDTELNPLQNDSMCHSGQGEESFMLLILLVQLKISPDGRNDKIDNPSGFARSSN